MDKEMMDIFNKKIISEYESVRDDIKSKYDRLNNLKSDNLEGTLLNDLDSVILSLENSLNELNDLIEKMDKQVKEGKNLLFGKSKNDYSLLRDSDKEESVRKSNNDMKNVDEDINRINRALESLDRINNKEIMKKPKKSLESRIKELQKKKGVIQNKQGKILDLEIKNRISDYANKRFNKSIVNVEKDINTYNKTVDKIEKLEEKEKVDNYVRDFSDNKFEQLRYIVVSKIDKVRLNRLKNKVGFITHKNNRVIATEVNEEKKTKARTKLGLFKESLVVGMNAYKENMENRYAR